MQVMETRKTKLGEDHPETLASMARGNGFYARHKGVDEYTISGLAYCKLGIGNSSRRVWR